MSSTPTQAALHTPRQVNSVTEDHVLSAILGVIQTARQQGQSIEQIKAAVLADDALLEQPVRQLLSDIVSEAWNQLT